MGRDGNYFSEETKYSAEGFWRLHEDVPMDQAQNETISDAKGKRRASNGVVSFRFFLNLTGMILTTFARCTG
jgi:hypothetical protein